MPIFYGSIDVTIEDILTLDHVDEDRVYGLNNFDIFEPINNLDTYKMTIETEDKITQRDYICDMANDGRSRQLSIIFYEGVPFAIYQYMGRGYVDNEVLFNPEVYRKLIKDYISEYMDKQDFSAKAVSVKHKYTINNYNCAYFEFKDNTLHAHSPKE